jgi:hypothetical protein
VFKKTFIALSVGAALGSVNANAVTFDFTPNAWTTEGAELVKNFVVPDITVTLEAEYSKDDVITFEFNADVTGAFNPTIDVTLADATSGTMTLGFVSSSANTVTYRVTELSAAGTDSISTDDATFTLTSATGSKNLVVGDQVRDASGLTATYSATTGISGLALDGTPAAVVDTQGTTATTDDTTKLVTFATQYATLAATSKLNGVIDVTATNERTLFTGGVATDEATISITETAATHDALTTGVTLSLAGDFSFLQDTNATTAGIQQAADVIYAELDGTRVQGTVNANADAVSFAFVTDTLGSIGIFFDNAPNLTQVTDTTTKPTVMERGSFTASFDVSYAPVKALYADADTTAAPVAGDYDTTSGTGTGDITSKSAGSIAAGAWTLNGASISVYSMPINNAAVTNYLYVTNSGSAGEVSMTATLADGTSITAQDIATVGANSITNITPMVEAALAGAAGNRATVELTFNAPACNIVVSAAYNVAGDRLPLETSQTLDGSC